MDYALSSGGGNTEAGGKRTTVETVQVSNGVASCGNGNNGEPRGNTNYNSNCDAVTVVDPQFGPINEGARTSPRAASRRTQRTPTLVCS